MLVMGQFAFLIFGFIVFLMQLLAFGIKKHNKMVTILQIVLYLYAVFYGCIVLITEIPNSYQKVLGGVLIAIQLGRYFLCNF